MTTKFVPSTTQHGMPGLQRPPAVSRDRLVRLARAAVPMLTQVGAVNTAAVCDAYLAEVAENDLLRRQLASLSEWREEPTRQAKVTPRITDMRETEPVDVPEDTLTSLRAMEIPDEAVPAVLFVPRRATR